MRPVFLLLSLGLVLSQARAANLAIVDSGVDYKHKDLSSHMWTNPNTETVVEGTTYKSDTRGWNFADNNNEVIDYKYLGTFSADCSKMFAVQGKILKGSATEEEKTWYKSKKDDAEFLKELGKFGNFVHGSHVSGISSRDSAQAHLQALKIIATEPPGSMLNRLAAIREEGGGIPGGGSILVKLYLQMAAQQQGKLLTTIGKYVNAIKADVANGSFGTSVAAVTPVVKNLMKQLGGADPTDAEVKDNAIFLVNAILESSKTFVSSAPNTLFVFAAGNDGSDNDALPESPANIKTDNTISVAASFGVDSLATFSCYGAKMVDVAAPGVIINSTIPGDQYLELSGTSMAAPFVTNVAGMVKDANPKLGPAEIKKILTGTVDVKSFLQGKVSSSGIVNRDRAVTAAKASVNLSLDEAIHQARASVADMASSSFHMNRSAEKDMLVLPLPSLF